MLVFYRKITFLIVMLTFFGIVLFWYQKQSIYASVATDEVKRGTVESEIIQTGVVEPQQQQNLYSPIEGIIQDVYVNEGDTVKSGQKLVFIKNLATNEQRAAAYDAYIKSLTLDTKLQQDMERLQFVQQQIEQQQNTINSTLHSLAPDVSASASASLLSLKNSEIEQALPESSTLSEFAQVRQSLKEAYQETLDKEIMAPFDGVIVQKNVVAGSLVSANLSRSPLFSIAGNSKLGVHIILDEDQQKYAGVGTKVGLQEVINGEEFSGKIVAIQDVPFNFGVSGEKDVVIDALLPSDKHLENGQKMVATIKKEKKDGVLVVPNSAIGYQNQTPTVEIIRRSNPPETVKVPVTVGLQGLQNSEIVEGVSEGMRIVVE